MNFFSIVLTNFGNQSRTSKDATVLDTIITSGISLFHLERYQYEIDSLNERFHLFFFFVPYSPFAKK